MPRRKPNKLGYSESNYYRKLRKITSRETAVVGVTEESIPEEPFVDLTSDNGQPENKIIELKNPDAIARQLLTLAGNHNLSDTCMDDVLRLVNSIASGEIPNRLYSSYSDLQKTLQIESVETKCHARCSACKNWKSKSIFSCPFKNMKCCDLVPSVYDNHFITFNIENLLQLYLPTMKCSKSSNSTDELNQSEAVRRIKCQNNVENDYTLTLNTDGASVFKSSRCSMWPILGFINEQSAIKRKNNVIMLGIWIGKEKPDFNVYLDEVISQLKVLEQKGMLWKDYVGNVIRSKIYLLCVMCDSIARPLVQMTFQFNGKYGCPYCYAKKGKGETHYFHYIKPEEMELRSKESYLQDLQLVREGFNGRGIKGRSPFLDLNNFDPVYGFPPDILHCVYLGIVRQLTMAWISSSNNSTNYYLNAASVAKMNSLLISKKPPNRVSRVPRSLQYCHIWKGHEWSMWLYYYSPIILDNILPQAYYKHWLSLVRGMTLITGSKYDNVSHENATSYFQFFVSKIEDLYTLENCTFNSHLLLHLPTFAKTYGPLHYLSLTTFENFNHVLTKFITSSQYISTQIAKRFLRHSILKYHKGKELPKEQYTKSTCVKNGMAFFDPFKVNLSSVDDITKELFSRFNINDGDLECYQRMMNLKNKKMYYSKLYKKLKVRNGYTVALNDGTAAEVDYYIVHKKLNAGLFLITCHNLARSFHNVDHIKYSTNSYKSLMTVDNIREISFSIISNVNTYFINFINSIENSKE